MAEEVVIRVEDLWKQYGLPLPKIAKRLRQSLKGKSLSSAVSEHWALKDVSFEVERGETLGIIGSNGAGKSTLLKILAGVTPATRGRVKVEGRIFPMIELNAGIHPELTGRENIRLLGAIMGFSRQEIEGKMGEIEGFCELGEWFDRPVRMYSSGMLARLGFGVAVNVDAKVLLVDEVLAVGDLAFRSKCFQRLEAMRSSGITILFVSHNLRQVDRLCDRVVLLEAGQVQSIGPPGEVVQAYYELNQEVIAKRLGPWTSGVGPEVQGDVVITNVEFLDEVGKPIEIIEMFKPLTIRLHYSARKRIENPILVIGILSPEMLQITNFNTANLISRPSIQGTGYVDCIIPQVHLLPGNYGIKCIIMTALGLKLYRAEGIAWFRVSSDTYEHLRSNAGFVYTPVRWQFMEADG